MRVAVLSDIHANLTALDAVVADIRMHAPDAVVVGGDLVGSGSRPAEVIDRIREIDWPVIQGNSDEMRWNAARLHAFLARPVMHPFVGIIERARAATLAAIGHDRLAWLRAQAFQWRQDVSLSCTRRRTMRGHRRVWPRPTPNSRAPRGA